jgi:hypothetical protein
MDVFEPVFIEFIQLLNTYDVEYLLIGGMAVNLHGYSRPTGDMDIWINPTNSNGQKLIKAIDEFGYDTTELEQKDFEQTDVFFLGKPPFRIDILNRMQGLKFGESYPKRIIVEHEGILIHLLSLEDLKVNKLLAGRHKDLNDLENLTKDLDS